jgi:predicted AAA+ superfamily ATPase
MKLILDIFSGTFLLRRLPPHFANVGKRLIKSPKLYLRDTGLLHFLLGIDFTKKALLSHPKAGASFETFCIEQILHHALLVDPSAQGFFYRTSGGAEIDLLLQLKGKLIPIEIKMSSSPTVPPGMVNAMKDLGLKKGYIVNFVKKPRELKMGILQCDLLFLLKELGICL